MMASALNFAIGFFGYPFDGQYQQSIIIESEKVRQYPPDPALVFGLNTIQFKNPLAPYRT